MSAPSTGNLFTDILTFGAVMSTQQYYETRLENDSSGKVLYSGVSIIPNAPTDEPVWYILKMYYDGNGFISRLQKPDGDFGMVYSWDLRATYFS